MTLAKISFLGDVVVMWSLTSHTNLMMWLCPMEDMCFCHFFDMCPYTASAYVAG